VQSSLFIKLTPEGSKTQFTKQIKVKRTQTQTHIHQST